MSGRLAGKTTIITGGNTGIGRAVSLAFASEGSNLVIGWYEKEQETNILIEKIKNIGVEVLAIKTDVRNEVSIARLVRAGIKKFGKSLLGLDPTELTKINSVMDANLKGHNYVKSPIDMACWDILGKYTKQPIWKILGGAK